MKGLIVNFCLKVGDCNEYNRSENKYIALSVAVALVAVPVYILCMRPAMLW